MRLRPVDGQPRPAGAWLFAAPVAFLLLFFVWPLARVLTAAGSADAWTWIAGEFVRRHLAIAVLQATASTALSLAVGLGLAWYYHRYRPAGTGIALAVHAAPFILPVFVVVDGMRETLGANGWLAALGGPDLLAAMGPFWAVVLAHVYYNHGFAARILYDVLERRPHRLEQAAALLGARPRDRIAHVLAPLLAPPVAAVALIVWMFTFTSFGVVLLLGQGQVHTLETLLYQNTRGVLPRMDRAAALGVLQLLLNVVVVAAYFALRRRSRLPPQVPQERPAASGRMSASASPILVGLGALPMLAVLLGGFRVAGAWTLDAWRALLDSSHPAHVAGFDLTTVVVRSIGYAVAAAALATALALALAYGLERSGRLRRVAEAAAAVPLGTSSILLGLGFLFAFGATGWPDLRGQAAGIVAVHTLVGFPFAARIVLPAFQQRSLRLDEAAALLGASPRAMAWRLHVPMLRAPIAAAAGLAAAISLGDFGASLVLMREDTMGLAVWIARHDQPFQPLAHAQSVALTALLMALAAAAATLAFRAGRGRIA